MKVKDLQQIIDTYNPELDFSFIVFEQVRGKRREDIISKTYAEDWYWKLNEDSNELEIIIDL